MNIFDFDAIRRLRCNGTPSEREVELFRKKIDFDLDSRFLELMTLCNGGEGFVTDQFFLQLWTMQQILELNPYYEDVEICRNLCFFGTDGSNLGFAFNKQTGQVVSIDFLELGRIDPRIEAASFAEFLTNIVVDGN